MYNFNSILSKSSKNVTKDLIYSEYDAQSFYKIVKQYYDAHPEASEEDVYKYIEELFFQINFDIAKLPIIAIKQSTLEYSMCRFLNKNDRERKEIFNQVIKEEHEKGNEIFDEEEQGRYTSNISSSSRLLTIKIIKELRALKNKLPEESRRKIESFFKLPRKYQSEHKRTLTAKGRREIEELRELFDGDEFTQFSIALRKSEPMIEKNLKNDYITSLLILGKRFKQFGLLETYSKKQEKALERMGIRELTYPLLETEEGNLGLEDLFKRENLEKLSLEQLSMLNAFWLNRFTKELESMNKSFFISKKLGLIGKIKDASEEKNSGYIRVQIEEEKLKNLYEKMNFLHEIANIMFKEVKTGKYETILEEFTENDNEVSIKITDAMPIFEKIEDYIGNDYRKHFSNKQPDIEHDFLMDIQDYTTMENAMHNTYKAKDLNIIAILSSLYQENFSKNWGIIREEKPLTSKMMLLGIDLKGLNMPIRLHISKDLVCDFLRSYKGDMIFPLYEGERDFYYEGRPFSTQILMPLCKKQKDVIKELMQKGKAYNRNLIEHISFLSEGNYPEHLKVECITGKKGKRKVSKQIPPRRFVDLSTGEEYIEDKNGGLKIVKKENTQKIEGR